MCPYCPYELASTQHFLLECPQHKFARIKLRLEIKHITSQYFSINLLLNSPTDVADDVRDALFAYLKIQVMTLKYDRKVNRQSVARKRETEN